MKVIAAVDRSEFADPVVAMAKRVAKEPGSEILVLQVAPREPDVLGRQLTRKVITDPVPADLQDRRELLDRLAAELQRDGFKNETQLIRGKPAPTILDEARRWGADLIVIGSHGRSMLFRQLLGSVSKEVFEARQMPVLIVFGPAGSH